MVRRFFQTEDELQQRVQMKDSNQDRLQLYLTKQQLEEFEAAKQRGYVELRGMNSQRLHNAYWHWCVLRNQVYCEVSFRGKVVAVYRADAWSTTPTYKQPEIGNEFCNRFYELWKSCAPKGKDARILAGKESFEASGIPVLQASNFAEIVTKAIHENYQAALKAEKSKRR